MLKTDNIILKLSGEILSEDQDVFGESGFKLILDEIKSAREIKPNLRIGIVIGGGNIYRGRQNIFTRVTGDSMGMLATVINSIALKDYFDIHGLKSKLFTPFIMSKIGDIFTVEHAMESLDAGKVNLYAGGTGNPFFSTDSLAVLRALETGSTSVLKATKVPGVFSADPVKDNSAEKFDAITHLAVVQKELNVMDFPAITLAMEHNLNIFVFDFFKKGNLRKVIEGDLSIGTIVNT